jgi:hypothetical protein
MDSSDLLHQEILRARSRHLEASSVPGTLFTPEMERFLLGE